MQLEAIVQQTFGFAGFRPRQREIIEHILSPAGAEGTLVVMPTGGGKSLIYQVAALTVQRLSIVVSPLIALMKDQVDALRARGVAAACVHSGLSTRELIETRDRVLAGQIRLLYVAPERFKNRNFMAVVARQPLYLLAIDEAHCISHWGSGFRPSYRHLPAAIAALRPDRVLALTATANHQTRHDICTNLGLPRAHCFITGFRRDDLRFGRCRLDGNAYFNTRDAVLDRYDPEADSACGIVYLGTRKNCERLVADLERWSIPVAFYHAGMRDVDKQRVQEEWMRRDGVMVATTAFGMGIDKPNVRFVINGSLPANVEEWYQMIGRGSRDGRGCHCQLFSDAEDLRIRHFLLEIQYPPVTELRRFRRWLDATSRTEGERTLEATQDDLAAAAGIRPHTASGCCTICARYGLMEQLAPGRWRLLHRPEIRIDEAELERQRAAKLVDLERVRRIIRRGGDLLGAICTYLERGD